MSATARKAPRQRADRLLIESGLAQTPDEAARLILAGKVYLPHEAVKHPGQLLPRDSPLHVKQAEHPYASRGGVKLAAALAAFQIPVGGKSCLDIGISTGGFSDCLFRHGASRIIGIDVGYGQVATHLQRDPRLTLLERTNFFAFDWKGIPFPVEIIVADVSFASILRVMNIISTHRDEIFPKNRAKDPHNLNDDFCLLCLLKPQFEVERHQVSKGGVVTDPELQQEALEKALKLGSELGWGRGQWIPSPILGRKGNQEYLLYWKV